MTWKKLTGRQWAVIQPHLPPPTPKPKGGRPPLGHRQCFEGILWILWTGAQGKALPKEFGSSSAVHRRLGPWAKAGLLLNLWRAFLSQLNETQPIRWNQCFVDGTFVSAKKGVQSRPNQAGQGKQAHGTSRGRGYSARSSPGSGITGRSDTAASHHAAGSLGLVGR
jgi:transposase